MPHFLWESVVAGIDVARRACATAHAARNPASSTCPLDFPPGLARNTFATITSLLPGSVPSGEDEDALVYHCLDTSQPVVEQLWKEERLLSAGCSWRDGAMAEFLGAAAALRAADGGAGICCASCADRATPTA